MSRLPSDPWRTCIVSNTTLLRQVKPSLIRKRSDAGRIGGLQTLLRHGREHYSAAGKLGGRPKSLTMAEIRQSQHLEEQNENRRLDTPHSRLKELKVLWANKTGGGFIRASAPKEE